MWPDGKPKPSPVVVTGCFKHFETAVVGAPLSIYASDVAPSMRRGRCQTTLLDNMVRRQNWSGKSLCELLDGEGRGPAAAYAN